MHIAVPVRKIFSTQGGHKMKRCHSLVVVLAAALALAGVGLAGTAQAGTKKVKGTFTGTETATGPNIDVAGQGKASTLGKFTVVYQYTLTPIAPPQFSTLGTGAFTTANGDTLFATGVGTFTCTDNSCTTATVTEVWTITGGTGRYAGATGSITMDRNLTGIGTGATTTASFTGTITTP